MTPWKILLVVGVSIAVQRSWVSAEDFSPDEVSAGQEERKKEISMLSDGIRIAEANKRKATTKDERERWTNRLSELRKALSEARGKSAEDFAAMKRQKLANDEKRAESDAAVEAERIKVSGNCPLQPQSAGFAHLTEPDVIGVWRTMESSAATGITALTAISFDATNKASTTIDAWELSYELLDGFDEVLFQNTHRGTRLLPGERASVKFSAPHAPDAVQMTIYVQRVKTADGTLWERKPEHRRVGLLVKRLDGADLRVWLRPGAD